MADSIDTTAFQRVLKGLVDAFVASATSKSRAGAGAGAGAGSSTTTANAPFANANALSIDCGKLARDDPAASLVTSAGLHLLMLGYEFPDCIMVVSTSRKVIFLTTPKKAAYLKPCADACNASSGGVSDVSVEVLVRAKAPDTDDANYAKMLAAIKPSSSETPLVVGRLGKESPTGRLVDGWRAVIQAEVSAGRGSVVDCTLGVDLFLAHKRKPDVDAIRDASRLSTRTLSKLLVSRVERYFGSNDPTTHSKLCAKVEDFDRFAKFVKDDRMCKEWKLDPGECDFLAAPVVQSGGSYTSDVLTLKANDKTLQFDTVVASLGCRYKRFGSCVTRTYFVDPTPAQEATYEALLAIHRAVIDSLLPGVTVAVAMKTAVESWKASHATLAPYLNVQFGCSLGIVPERSVALTLDSDVLLEPNMVFYVSAALENLPMKDAKPGSDLAKLKTYSMMVGDTVVVSQDGAPVEFTAKALVEPAEVCWRIKDEEDDSDDDDDDDDDDDGDDDGGDKTEDAKAASKRRAAKMKEREEREAAKAAAVPDTGVGAGGRRRRNAAAAAITEEEMRRREERQRELMLNMATAAREKAEKAAEEAGGGGGGAGAGAGAGRKAAPKITAYKTPALYPTSVKPSQVYVDKTARCVLIPINGMHVPFAISTIKSITKTEEGGLAYLRLVFYSPGASLGKDSSPSVQDAVATHGNRMFVQTITVKSKHHGNLNSQVLLLKQVQRTIRQAHQAEAQKRDLVKQAALKIDRKKRVPNLKDLSMRPTLSGRKSEGTLEAHSNGFRFVTNRGERLDIIYANIRHAIFQPCKAEHIVLLHFRLKNPILVNKKKTRDVQFFTEVIDMSQRLDAARNTYDPDEFEEESRERALRDSLNKAFAKFVRRVEDVVSGDRTSTFSEFSTPSRNVGFHGVPHKEMVVIMPCTDCLVSLTETPPFVLSLDDIEHVHFEGVQFSSRNFDMVIVFTETAGKALGEEFHRISAIPMTKLDDLKDWLTEVVDKTYTEGVVPLNWKQIIADIVRQPEFWHDVDELGDPKPIGWEFLKMAPSDGEDEEESESEYEEPDDDSDADSDADSDDDDDFDDAVDSEESSDDDEDFGDGSSEEGEDWDTLHQQAEMDDRKRGREGDDADDDRRKKSSSKSKKRDKHEKPPKHKKRKKSKK